MLTVQQFIEGIESGPVLSVPPAFALWETVKNQAITHTRRLERSPVVDAMRPNESEISKGYRARNQRHLTREPIDKFTGKVSRIIVNSSFSFIALSPEASAWINSRPFRIAGRNLSLNEYFLEVVLPCMIEDPNAVIVAFPFNPLNPQTPPAAPVEFGGLSDNVPVSIKPLIVSSCDIRHVGNDFIAWEAGQWAFTDNKKQVTAPFYIFADDQFYYRYLPVSKPRKHNSPATVYELEVWYEHGTGKVPGTFLGGTLTKSEHGERMYYESFLHPYFEYADEFAGSFSDNQAIRVQHSFPKTIIDEIPCDNSDCRDGKLIGIKEDGQRGYMGECGTCHGLGHIRTIHPYDVIVRPKPVGMEPKQSGISPVLEYKTPPIESLEHSYKVVWDLLERAKRSICLDLLIDVGESGTAKSRRLDDLKDLLRRIGSNLFSVMEDYLCSVEALLNPVVDSRIMPVIQRPNNYGVEDEQKLLNELNNAPASDRVCSVLAYYKKKYQGDAAKIRAKEFALKYAPLSTATLEEIKTYLALGVCSKADVKKASIAENIFLELSKQDDFLLLSYEQAAALADEMAAPFLPVEPVAVMESGENVTDGQS